MARSKHGAVKSGPLRKPGRLPEKRAPGRPQGDRPQLRPQLLGAALACFARDGIAATSLRTVAAEAGVSPAMLHYYFGDKSQLVKAVIEERIEPAFRALRLRLRADDDIAALVAAFVTGIGELVARHPWLPALWVREALCEGGALRDLLVERIASLPLLLAQRFGAAQAAGQLDPRLDPRLLVVSLIGLTLFPAAGAAVWQRMFATPVLDAEALRGHTLALLEGGLGAGLQRRQP